MEWMSHWKRRETKQQPRMLPGPAVPGSCLVSFHFLCNIHSIHSVRLARNLMGPQSPRDATTTPPPLRSEDCCSFSSSWACELRSLICIKVTGKSVGHASRTSVSHPTARKVHVSIIIQCSCSGWPTGYGKKLSSSQAQLGQTTCLALA